MSVLYLGLGLSLAIMSAVFFAGSETGVLSADIHRLQRLANGGSKSARRLLNILEQKEYLLATLLIGNNLAVVTASALTTSFLARFINRGEVAALLSVALVTPVILIVGEILPKAVYLSQGTSLLLHTEWVLRFLLMLFRPVTTAILVLPRLVTRTSRDSISRTAVTREEFRGLIHTGALQHQVQSDEQSMIRRLLDFKEKRVTAVMVPLIDAVSIPETAQTETAINMFHRSGFSRLPVYRARPDQVVGIINAADFFKIPDLNASIIPLLRKPLFVPEQMKVTGLFSKMLQGNEIAVVVDEYGVAVGMVTAEDVLEEIVGDIRDEFDRSEKPMVTRMTPGVFVVDGRMTIEEFNEELHSTLPPGDYATIAGLLTNHFQKIPERGESYVIGGLKISVLEASRKRVSKLLVRLEEEKKNRGKEE